jgi:hypothetical protein
VASLVLSLLLVSSLLLERTGVVEIDERAIQPEVISCQVGHKDMKVRVQGSGAAYGGEVVPRYEFGLPRSAGAPCTTGTAQRRTSFISTWLILRTSKPPG